MPELATENNVNSKSVWMDAPFARLAFRVGAVVLLFILLDHWILSVSELSESSYSSPVLLIELMGNLLSSPFNVLISGLLIALLVVRFDRFLVPWTHISHSRFFPGLAVFLAFILSLWFATYDYNLYFDRGHILDRVLLVVLTGLIAWRPVFILPFLLVATTIIWQFFVPFENSYSWAQPSMPLRLLTMLVALHLFYALTGTKVFKEWIFLCICLIAAHYWAPGLAKAVINWITYGNIYNLLSATYANGWLAFLTPEQISSLSRTISDFDWMIRISTLALQLGAVFILWNRISMFAFLGCWTLFHAGIFLVSGIFFWQWIAIEVFIVLLLRNMWKQQGPPFLQRHYFLLSIALIMTSVIWANPVKLAWFDTSLSYTYRFAAQGESGKTYTLPPRFFSPYQYSFTLGRFSYLSKDPLLGIVWGGTRDRKIANRLLQAQTVDAIEKIEAAYGKVRFDPKKIDTFEKFIKMYIRNLNRRGEQNFWPSTVQAPRQLWTFPRGDVYDYREPITKITVSRISSWFDGNAYKEIRARKVHHINIMECS